LKTGWETAEKKMEANKEQSKLSKKFQWFPWNSCRGLYRCYTWKRF
jgi:hypothetical protein